MSRTAIAWLACILLLSLAPLATGQAYPSRPIRFIVPYPPGGGGDLFARTIGQKLAEAFGQQVVIENRPGANGIIGTEAAARATPDGYTIVMANSAPMVVNPSLYRKLPYDPVNDFAPVTQGTSYGYCLVVHPSVPARDLRELVGLAKGRPGEIAYGSAGSGAANHLAGELLALMAGLRLVHVPYKGSSLALGDVMGGHLPMMFDPLVTAMPQIRAGRLRAIAMTGPKRSHLLPELPTIDESGYRGYEITSWQAIMAPAGTPHAVVDRLHQETVRALKMPDVIQRLATQGGHDLVGNAPDELAALIRREMTLYARIVREARIRAE